MYDTDTTEKLLHFIRSELDRSLDRVEVREWGITDFHLYFFSGWALLRRERESHGKCCIVCSRIGWRFSADRIIYHKTASIRQKAAAACVYTVFVLWSLQSSHAKWSDHEALSLPTLSVKDLWRSFWRRVESEAYFSDSPFSCFCCQNCNEVSAFV